MKQPAKPTAHIKVTVRPRSSRQQVEVVGDSVVVRVTAPPVQGKANEMCLTLIADWLGVPKSRLTIISGTWQREKIIGIAGLEQAELDRRLRADR